MPLAGKAQRLKLLVELQLNFLAERALQLKRVRPIQFGGAGHGKGLEPGAIHPARLEARFLELGRNVVGCLVDALGIDAAAFALVGGEKEDVLLHRASTASGLASAAQLVNTAISPTRTANPARGVYSLLDIVVPRIGETGELRRLPRLYQIESWQAHGLLRGDLPAFGIKEEALSAARRKLCPMPSRRPTR